MAKKEVKVSYNPDWLISYEYQHGKDLIVPGTQIKFKYNREIYKFEKYVINQKTNKEWLDVIGPSGYKSFYVEDLKGTFKPKVRRRKNV